MQVVFYVVTLLAIAAGMKWVGRGGAGKASAAGAAAPEPRGAAV